MPQLVRNLEKDLHHRRIELRAGAAQNLFPRHVEAARLAIRAVTGDGVQRIGNRKNARANRNPPRATAGIATAVEVFLVRKDNLGRFAEKRNLAQNVIPRVQCSRITSCSSGVSVPGLRRISSGIAILPISCRNAPRAITLIPAGRCPSPAPAQSYKR